MGCVLLRGCRFVLTLSIYRDGPLGQGVVGMFLGRFGVFWVGGSRHDLPSKCIIGQPSFF